LQLRENVFASQNCPKFLFSKPEEAEFERLKIEDFKATLYFLAGASCLMSFFQD